MITATRQRISDAIVFALLDGAGCVPKLARYQRANHLAAWPAEVNSWRQLLMKCITYTCSQHSSAPLTSRAYGPK